MDPFQSKKEKTLEEHLNDLDEINNNEEISIDIENETEQQKQEQKERKKPNRRKTKEEIETILKSYYKKDTSVLEKELGLTRQQVYRTIKDARDILYKELEQTSDENKKEKITDFMKRFLPEKKFGGNNNNSKNQKVNDVLNEISKDNG